MRALRLLLILLASLGFTLALLGAGGGTTELAVFPGALMISGAVFTSAAALDRRPEAGPGASLPEAQDGNAAADESAAGPGTATIRWTGFHRRAA